MTTTNIIIPIAVNEKYVIISIPLLITGIKEYIFTATMVINIKIMKSLAEYELLFSVFIDHVNGNERKQDRVDPTVQCLVDLFPEEYLREQIREAGLLKRERRIDIVMLFWVLVLGFGIGLLRSLRGMKHKYN